MNDFAQLPPPTPEEAKVLLTFLDRVPITGHQERQSMNLVVQKLAMYAKAAPPQGNGQHKENSET